MTGTGYATILVELDTATNGGNSVAAIDGARIVMERENDGSWQCFVTGYTVATFKASYFPVNCFDADGNFASVAPPAGSTLGDD
jgi:hypothetical protein